MGLGKGSFDLESFGLGVGLGVALAALYVVAFHEPHQPAPALTSEPTAHVAPAECAMRTVYFTTIEDDWGQRALIANTVLNQATAPGVARPPCAFPSPFDAGGPLPDPYQVQAARDAVEAVSTGSYEVPAACAAATKVLLAFESPRAQCVYGGLAFVQAR